MNILDKTSEKLAEYLSGQPKFRAKQVYEWLYRGISDFDEMTNISRELREQLKKDFYIYIPNIKKKLCSKIDGTRKYLFEMKDGAFAEGVVMKYKYGLSMCISSQVGCRMGCAFCASTLHGLQRNLTSGEIMGQILAAQKDLGERISNIVMMGSGEPFDNMENVIDFIKNAVNPAGLGIGARHITISTCGIISGIQEMKELGIPVNLSVSLHAPNDTIRREIMPIARAVPISKLIEEIREYFRKTHRRVTFEYALISGVNDSDDNARELSRLLSGEEDFHVNLIPVNNVNERSFTKSTKERIEAFVNILTESGIKATIRREMGADINAACGQLRNQNL